MNRKTFFPFLRSDRNTARFNIPASPKNQQVLINVKIAIGEADMHLALDILSKLNLPKLDAEILALQSRLSEFTRNRQQGVLSYETENVNNNRLNRDIIQLITTLERELGTDVENYGKIRQFLKKRYAHRLEQKLAGRQPVNLRRIPTTEGTSEETSATFVAYGSDEIRATTGQIFQDAHGRLLVTGTPGAGKTLVMLQLALELLDAEPNHLPVLLNLATWTSEYATLEAWMRKILPAELGVSKRYANDILQQNHLILLLDGFDEVKAEHRLSCLEAIGDYGAQPQRRYVISSREQEYREGNKDAPVWLQIEVASLTFEQLESELGRIGYQQPEALPLLQAIRQDALLREIAQTPFYFNTLQLIFADGEHLSDFRFAAKNVERRKMEIIERFLEEAFSMPDRYGSAEQKRRWLGFLASRMAQRNMVTFELVDLQFDWGRWSTIQRICAKLTFGLVTKVCYWGLGGFIVGLATDFVLLMAYILNRTQTPYVTHFTLLYTCFSIGVIGGFLFGFFVGIVKKNQRIITKEAVKWSNKGLIRGFKNAFITAWIVTLLFNLQVNPEDFKIINLGGTLREWISTILSFTFIFGFSFSFIEVLSNNQKNIVQITAPYQRFTASAKVLYFSILQHWLLRWQLKRAGVLPWDVIGFLNEMTTRHLLETDGATWRFRHRILQEHFAEQWKDA